MFTKQLLHGLLTQVHDTSFEVVYWDGSHGQYGDGPPLFRIILCEPGVVDRLRADLETGFADAYAEGRISVEGDLADVVATALRHRAIERCWSGRRATAVANAAGIAGRLAHHRSMRQRKQDIARHYDLGNDFFRLFLDASITYSCAYFHSPDDTLEQAQDQKIEHSLAKLQLRPGDTLLDVGCGWGSLVMRAAEVYGAQALGITLSEEQEQAARSAIARKGLDSRCAVRLADYRELARQGLRFDRIISIGMIEHVGHACLSEFARAVKAMLVPGGLALLHSITHPWHAKDEAFTGGFIQRIFPGGYIPAISELTYHLAANGLDILDMENLREHYRLTLDQWSERYERNVEEVRERFGEEFVRLWRLYLRGCSAGFREGSLQVHQVLVSNGLPERFPLTRDKMLARGGSVGLMPTQ